MIQYYYTFAPLQYVEWKLCSKMQIKEMHEPTNCDMMNDYFAEFGQNERFQTFIIFGIITEDFYPI